MGLPQGTKQPSKDIVSYLRENPEDLVTSILQILEATPDAKLPDRIDKLLCVLHAFSCFFSQHYDAEENENPWRSQWWSIFEWCQDCTKRSCVVLMHFLQETRT